MFNTVNQMGKLRPQRWCDQDYIVLLGAGGANPCAAWAAPGTYKAGETVFDQTVYWVAVSSLREAAYLSGALNSPACAALIRRFQPRGAQGRRHVHKLPLSVTPSFSEADDSHINLADATVALADEWRSARNADLSLAAKLLPAHSNLQSRRRFATRAIQTLRAWKHYEVAARGIYDRSKSGAVL